MYFADVSVIIPVYNSYETIMRAVDSVINQTVLPREIIIVDDCSNDVITKELLKSIEYEQKSHVDITILYLDTNVGPGSARNRGMEVAKAKYIAFLDSDDSWHPQKLEIQYRLMESNPSLYYSSHRIVKIVPDKQKEFEKYYSNLELINYFYVNCYRMLFKHYQDGTPCVMIRNVKQFRFKEGKRYTEDCLLWLSILFKHKGAFIEKDLSAVYKDFYGDSGLTKDLWLVEKGEIEMLCVLYKDNQIGFLILLSAVTFSVIKYLRRILVINLK